MRKFLITMMCFVMVVCFMPTAAFADTTVNSETELQNAISSGGTITLSQDIILTGDLNIAAEVFFGGSGKIILKDEIKLTSKTDIYEHLKTDDKHYVAYSYDGNTFVYFKSDVTNASSGYDLYMAGHPTVIETLGDGTESHIKLTYNDNGDTYTIKYLNSTPAVVYGGVKDVTADLETTSLTLKSGTVTALVGGSKVSGRTGSVQKALINIEGGKVVQTSGCNPNGVITAVWYWGPDVEEFEFNMTGGFVQEIYGGATTSSYQDAKNSEFTVDKFTAQISGGKIDKLWSGASALTAGGNKTQTVKSAKIIINDSAAIGTIYGGGFANWNGSKAVVNSTEITINGGTVDTVFGGGQNGTSEQYNNSATSEVQNVVITVNGGTVGAVCGGGVNRHYNDRYWVDEDGGVVKKNYNATQTLPVTHYSNVQNATLNIKAPVNTVWLGGNSWAHVGTATANINANVEELSCIGNYGYVEKANINISKGVQVDQIDMVRSGIVGDVNIENSGAVTTLIAGAPANSYKSNMGVNKVAVLGSATVINNGSIENALLTYGLEQADNVKMQNVNLVVSSVEPNDNSTLADIPKKGVFETKDNSNWIVSEITIPENTTFNAGINSIAKDTIITVKEGSLISGIDGMDEGAVSAESAGTYICSDVNTVTPGTNHTHITDNALQYNDEYHWSVCTICGAMIGTREAHIFSNRECTVCDYVKPSPSKPYIPTIQKPTVEADANAKTTLSADGTKLTIEAAEGYEIADVTLNGVSKGAVKELTGLKTGDKVVVTTKAAANEPTLEEIKTQMAAINSDNFYARSKLVKTKSGKKAVKVTWYTTEDVEFDGVEIFRSTKRYSGYGTKPFYTTTKDVYYNTAIKDGAKYYYKVRGYVLVNGEKVYTDYSTKAWRTVK